MSISKWADRCICGGVTGCIVSVVVCLFGIPLFTAGVVLVSTYGIDGSNGLSRAGRVMLTIAMLMVAVGLVAIIYMCRMGPRFLKTTPGPSKRKQPKDEQYQNFINDAKPTKDCAPPGYAESANHRQYYPINSQAHQPNYHTTYPTQPSYATHPTYQTTKGNSPAGQLPQGQQQAMSPRPDFVLHPQGPGGFVPSAPYQMVQLQTASAPEPQAWAAATAPPYGEAAQWQAASAPPPPPAYGEAPPCENAGPLPMKI